MFVIFAIKAFEVIDDKDYWWTPLHVSTLEK